MHRKVPVRFGPEVAGKGPAPRAPRRRPTGVPGHCRLLPACRRRLAAARPALARRDVDAEDPGCQAPVHGVEDGRQVPGQDRDTLRAADLLRSQDPPRWQAGPGSPVRRDPADTEEERGPLRPHACTNPHPAQGADPPAPQTAVRAVRGTRQGAGAPGPETRQPGERRAKPARMGGAHGQDAAQDPGGLHALSQPRPRPPCHERGINHRRATCAERRPRGSEEGRTEKGLPPGKTPRRAAYPVSLIHPGAECCTGVNRDRPLEGGVRRSRRLTGRDRWSAPESLEAAMSANLPLVYQMLALYNRFPRTLSVAYLRCRSEALPRYTSAPNRQWRPSHRRRLASHSEDR